ncbi:MAG: hypothetical protein AAFR76_01485 [Planctomycetota bacterium]
MKIAQALDQISRDEITVTVYGDPVIFRFRAVNSSDLIQNGTVSLLAAAVKVGGDKQAILEKLAKDSKANPSIIQDALNMYIAAATAGVYEASVDGGQNWEKLTLVPAGRADNPEHGLLSVNAIPDAALQEIGQAVLALSDEGGEAGRRLARFLGRDAAHP